MAAFISDQTLISNKAEIKSSNASSGKENTNLTANQLLIFSASKPSRASKATQDKNALQVQIKMLRQGLRTASEGQSIAERRAADLKAKAKKWLKEKDIEIKKLERKLALKERKIISLEKEVIKIKECFQRSKSSTPTEIALRKENERLRTRISKLRSA